MVFRNKIVLATLTLLASLASLQAQTQKGKASYYSKSLTGHRTANGERLHHDSLTCAHKTYPFGTLLKVTNPTNGLHVVVRVTDRGPYVKGRIIDLSVRAARELGIISQGIAPVIVERYDQSIIPFKPADITDLPEFDLGTNEGSDTKPLWVELKEQEMAKIKEQNASAAKKKTAPKQQNKHETVTPKSNKVESQDNTKHIHQDDELDKLSKQPNKSKAYLKRSGNESKR